MPSRNRIPVTPDLARPRGSTAETVRGHRLAPSDVDRARSVLAGPHGCRVVERAAACLANQGWFVFRLPYQRDDAGYRRAAAGLLAAVGEPFHSIVPSEGGLWLRGQSSPDRIPSAFGGFGGQALHIDAPNTQRPPDYTALLMLRSDPAGGGASRIGDLRTAAARLTAPDRAVLARREFWEGRADGLRGVGRALLPFPVLEDAPGSADGLGWIRWAGNLLDDPRNQRRRPALLRFAELLAPLTRQVWLDRGDLLVLDQRRVAHGRTPLGDQTAVTGPARLLCQAKVRATPDAPVQRALAGAASAA